MPWAGAPRPWRPPKSCSDGVAQHAKDPVDDPFSKLSISLAADANLRLRRSRQSDPGRYGPNKGKPQVLRAYQGAGAGRAQVGLGAPHPSARADLATCSGLRAGGRIMPCEDDQDLTTV